MKYFLVDACPLNAREGGQEIIWMEGKEVIINKNLGLYGGIFFSQIKKRRKGEIFL